MALFVLCKPILQTRMRSHPVGLDVRFWSDPLSTSILHMCEQGRLWRDCTDAQAHLSGCSGSPECLLVANVINTIISWAGSNEQFYRKLQQMPLNTTWKKALCFNIQVHLQITVLILVTVHVTQMTVCECSKKSAEQFTQVSSLNTTWKKMHFIITHVQ